MKKCTMELKVLNQRRDNINAQLTKLSNVVADEAEKNDSVDISNKIENLNRLEDKQDELKMEC